MTVDRREGKSPEIPRVKFDADLPILQTDTFLPGWARDAYGSTQRTEEHPGGEFLQDGWRYQKKVDGELWLLTIVSHRLPHTVSLSTRKELDAVDLKGVNEVGIDTDRDRITFYAGGGEFEYTISNNGTRHSVKAGFGTLSAVRQL